MIVCNVYPGGHRIVTRGYWASLGGWRTECACGLKGIIPTAQVGEAWTALNTAKAVA